MFSESRSWAFFHLFVLSSFWLHVGGSLNLWEILGTHPQQHHTAIYTKLKTIYKKGMETMHITSHWCSAEHRSSIAPTTRQRLETCDVEFHMMSEDYWWGNIHCMSGIKLISQQSTASSTNHTNRHLTTQDQHVSSCGICILKFGHFEISKRLNYCWLELYSEFKHGIILTKSLCDPSGAIVLVKYRQEDTFLKLASSAKRLLPGCPQNQYKVMTVIDFSRLNWSLFVCKPSLLCHVE